MMNPVCTNWFHNGETADEITKGPIRKVHNNGHIFSSTYYAIDAHDKQCHASKYYVSRSRAAMNYIWN